MDAEECVAPQKLFEYWVKKARRFHILAIKSIGAERVLFSTLATVYQRHAEQAEAQISRTIEL